MTTFRRIPLCLLLIGAALISETKASCPQQCQPFGTCVDGECKCNDGFTGIDCSIPYETCPDEKRTCYNGATCTRLNVEFAKNERIAEERNGGSAYECNCQKAFGQSNNAYAGLECEHPASQVCEDEVAVSEYAFCTNMGKCKKIVRNGEAHAGCDCPPEFEGRHCQYAKGMAPLEELQAVVTYGDKSNSDTFDIVYLAICIIVVSLVAFVGLFAVRKRLTGKSDMDWAIEDFQVEYVEDLDEDSSSDSNISDDVGEPGPEKSSRLDIPGVPETAVGDII